MSHTLTDPKHSVNSVCFSADGDLLVSGSDDKTLKIWSKGSSGTFECESTLAGHSERVNCVVFSPNGKVIASCSGEGYMRDNSVRLWDASTGEPIGSPLAGHSGRGVYYRCVRAVHSFMLHLLTDPKHSVNSVCFSADSDLLVSGSDDKTLKVWSKGSSGTFECQSTLAGHSNR